MVKVGEKVWVVDATSRYAWKRDFVGQSGIIDKAAEKAVRVRLHDTDGEYLSVWFAKDCVNRKHPEGES